MKTLTADALGTTQLPQDEEFFYRNLDQHEEIIEGLAREGQLIAFGGNYGLGKSPMLQDLTVCRVHGLPWCGRRVKKGPVIAFDMENHGSTYRMNMISITSRYEVPLPTPAQLALYLQHDPATERNTAQLLTALKEKDGIFGLIDAALTKKPDALCIFDPVEMVFSAYDLLKKPHALELYRRLRSELLVRYPQAAFLLTFNLRKKNRNAPPPSLNADPRGWLEEISGSHDLMSRADVRLGVDFHDQDEVRRIINGVRRGEEMRPILIQPVEDSGFEPVPPREIDARDVLTKKQQEYWTALPHIFSFEDTVKAGLVPRSSLSRMTKRAESFGILTKQQDGSFRKIATQFLPRASVDTKRQSVEP